METRCSEPTLFTVKDTSPIDPGAFIEAVQPLRSGRTFRLLTLLKTRWTYEQLRSLLHADDHPDSKKVALLALGLVGGKCCVPELAVELRSQDRMVNEMAEHALWSVWFRCGTDQANYELARGAQALERRDFRHAITHFDRAIAAAPDFAEAYNQRALAHYLMEEYEPSIEDCRRTIELMPCHFGALAGMGHCYALWGRARTRYAAMRRRWGSTRT